MKENNLTESTNDFPRTPADGLPQPDFIVRSTTVGIAAGASNYIVSTELIANAASSFANEASALAMAGAFAIFASMKNLKSLCRDISLTKSEESQNIVKGTVGGLTLGASLAAITGAALVSWIDGGLLLACTVGGVIFGRKKTIPCKRKIAPIIAAERKLNVQK